MEYAKSIFNNFLLNSTIAILAVITCFGYIFAYQFEVGYAQFFNIPSYLVQIDPLRVTLDAVLVYLVLFGIGFLIFILTTRITPFILKPSTHTNKLKEDIVISRIMIFLILLAVIILLPNSLGRKVANDNKSYFVFTRNNKSYVTIKSYGDLIVAKEFNEKAGILKNNILLIPKNQTIEGTIRKFERLIVE